MGDLPNNWVVRKLPEVVFFQEGTGLRKFQYRPSGIPFLNIRTLVNGRVNRNLCQHISEEEVQQKYQHFLLNAGDIICSTSGTLGKTAVVHEEDLPLLLNTSVMRFRTLDENVMDQRFIHLYLKSELFLNQAFSASTGSAQVNVGPTHLKTFDIPVPPLDEQKRIAEKLDSLLTRVDSCESHLERVPQILKRFRQSVLAAATSGRLTEEWREENAVNGEWEESTFGETGSVSGGLTKNQKRNLIEWRKPYLRVANVYANKLELDDVSEIGLTQTEFEKTRLLKDDLLIVEGNGSLEQIGRAAIWNDEVPDCVHQNHIIRWRTNGSVLPKFALFWLLSPEGRSFMVSVASSTSGLNTLSISKVSSIPIRLPSLEEQAEIVRRVESLFAYAERLEARYLSASERVARLTPSLLAKAFRGELVEQDPNDKSAVELLERVKAGRDDVQPQKASPRGRKGRDKK